MCFRELIDKKHQKVSDAAINYYLANVIKLDQTKSNSKFQEPTKSEGIDEIVKINFVPNFKDPDHKKLYKMFLL
ncbi:Bifunctional polynucleotide phosphatase/kinase [Aphis craccivora]|uniref:Bifunctional polynucleotide phosphatase/kinase n=1 Tax=Aphis craccivora TaxID=307492 RepID=A0A6G0Y0I1_APHCR|nr:Bifunctional polynucleotide phosphatase/kinase [Aphis craccivora]